MLILSLELKHINTQKSEEVPFIRHILILTDHIHITVSFVLMGLLVLVTSDMHNYVLLKYLTGDFEAICKMYQKF